jgi:biopolymer transport protein ExbB/TolQ
MIDFLRDNFWHVAPNVLAGLVAVAIVVERINALFYQYPLQGYKRFFDRIRELVVADRLGEAIAFCDLYPGKPIAMIAKEGLIRAHQPEPMIEDGLAIAVNENAQRITKRTGFLATIANVATLMGLLGTIAGLIHSFEAVGHADAQQKSALLAAGISTAMNATMLGLGIAIPCMVAFSFLMNKSNRLNAELENAAIKTLDVIRQRYYGADQKNDKAA